MRFSVIVPIYQIEDYLVKCVDSVLAQTFPDFEVILVDDGSPDRCPRICDEYAKKDGRVRVLHHPNGGLISARNVGVRASRGDYICYVDGDDWIKPNLLQFVSDRLTEKPVPPDMVIFGGYSVRADRLDPFLNGAPTGYYDRARLEKEIFPYLLSDRREGFRPGTAIMGHTWNKVCRRELQERFLVRDERIRMFEDVPRTYECLLNCDSVYICNEQLYYYNRTNVQSMVAVNRRNYLTKNFQYLLVYMRERFQGYGPDIQRELNDFPALLITQTMRWRLGHDASFSEAVRHVKEGLKESDMLRFVSLRGLPLKQKCVIFLLKAHCFRAALLLTALRVRKEEKSG